ncbi:MAG: chromosomal replication initiator protein DnaA [Eubacteriales bacterium]|nr:chromosomal replication initiator protein DnaA [Eubacteriales bacterium]
MDELTKLWNETLQLIKEKTTPVSFTTWFLKIRTREMDTYGRVLYLEADDTFVVNILNNRYISLIEECAAQTFGENYKVIIKNAKEYDTPAMPSLLDMDNKERPAFDNRFQPIINRDLNKQKIFNPKYTFDNFVVGDGNRYAYAGAMAVAQNPAEAYNPFFIYGASGLGKTHLMHAIGIYMLQHNKDINVLYVSSEMFTNELIKAIGKKSTNQFKDKYRNVDALLIDDIQFLQGKDVTQEEFFYTFNRLYDMKKQIVISSDRSPKELTHLEERLRSRFSWNLIAQLTPADYETRIAILVQKSKDLGVEMDDDLYEVCCMIAEKITDNIRELEGALNRIVGFSKIMNEHIDKNFAKRILNDILNNVNSVTPEKIKTVVSHKYNIKISDMESSKRTAKVAIPRQIAMYLCRNMTEYSYAQIGNLFGGRHYTTVMHACDKIAKDLTTDEDLKQQIEEIKSEINNS